MSPSNSDPQSLRSTLLNSKSSDARQSGTPAVIADGSMRMGRMVESLQLVDTSHLKATRCLIPQHAFFPLASVLHFPSHKAVFWALLRSNRAARQLVVRGDNEQYILLKSGDANEIREKEVLALDDCVWPSVCAGSK